MFGSQSDAKRFFVDRIVAEAAAELKPLSDSERQMLSFSESDPEFIVDPALVNKLAAEISDEDYERKIAGLLERAYQARPGARQRSARHVQRGICGLESRRSLFADNDQSSAGPTAEAMVGFLALALANKRLEKDLRTRSLRSRVSPSQPSR